MDIRCSVLCILLLCALHPAVAAGAAGSGGVAQEAYRGDHITALSDADVLAGLSHSTESVRAAAASEAGRRKLSAAIPVLKELLKDPKDWVRHDAATALLELGDSSGVPFLRTRLVSRDEFVRSLAALTLARHGDLTGIPVARALLGDPSWFVRGYAIEAVSYASDQEEGWKALEQGASDESHYNRMTAARLAAGRSGDRAVALLRTLAKDKEYTVRFATAGYLAESLRYDVIPVLLDMLRDPEVVVGAKASIALTRITGYNKGVIPLSEARVRQAREDWLAWWDVNKAKFPPGGRAPATSPTASSSPTH